MFIPSYLKDKKIWLCTNREKQPLKINGQAYKGFLSDKELYTVTDCIEAVKSKIVTGLGIRIEAGIISGIDIDDCIDSEGNVSELAQEIIDTMQSYTEISPSGKGIHILFIADIPNKEYLTKNSKLGLEVYFKSNSRYLSFTGNRFNGYNIAERTKQVKTVLDNYMLKDSRPYKNDNKVNTETDKRTVKRDIKNTLESKTIYVSDFIRLYLGHTEEYKDKSESETDVLFLGYLARYCENDKNNIQWLFRNSLYYKTKDNEHKEKWDRLENETIEKVIKTNIPIVVNKSLICRTKEDSIKKLQGYYSEVSKYKIVVEEFKEKLFIFKENGGVKYCDRPEKIKEKQDINAILNPKLNTNIKYDICDCFNEYELELKWHLAHINDIFRDNTISLPIPQNNTSNNLRKGLSKGIATGVQLILSEEQNTLLDGFIKDRGIEILIKQYADKHEGINANSVIRLQDFFQNKWLENVLQIQDNEMLNFNANVNNYTRVVANINEYLDLRKLAKSDQNKKTILKEIEFLTDIKYKIKNSKGTQGIFLPLIRWYIRSRKKRYVYNIQF